VAAHDEAPLPPRPDSLESTIVLLDRVRAGDELALNALFERHLPLLRRWARGRLPAAARDLQDTGDLVQEALLNALRNLPTFEYRHEGALQAYLRQAVYNRIRDEVRRLGRRPPPVELTESREGDEASPLDLAIGQETAARYEAALERLREEDREAVIARVELGHSFEEIARLFDKPSSDAARMMVNRALMRLAEEMRRERAS
jgi:RNA polymerase sigma-70 factor (ECF subfamily)